MQTITTLLALTALSACTALDEGRLEQEDGGNCNSGTCSNSGDSVFMEGFQDANLAGMPNASGLSIATNNGRAALLHGGIKYELAVENDRLKGKLNGVTVLQGQALVGAEMLILEDGEPEFVIHVHGVRTVPYPSQYPSQNGATFEAYHFTRHMPDGTADPNARLCNREMLFLDPDDEYEVLFGLRAYEAIAFPGDRIYPESMTMDPMPDLDWVNFACAGFAPAKLHQMCQTCACRGFGPSTCTKQEPWRERQATYKLLGADYCGTGKKFTLTGTPLVWAGGNMQFAETPVDVEARWTESGASCIGRPRLEAYPIPELYPDGVMVAIEQECAPIPSCGDPQELGLDNALRISGNRLPYQ